MFFVSRELAVGVSVLVPVIVAGGTLFGSVLRSISREAKAATAEAHGVAGEVLNNVRTVKSFAAEELEEVGTLPVFFSHSLSRTLRPSIPLDHNFMNPDHHKHK